VGVYLDPLQTISNVGWAVPGEHLISFSASVTGFDAFTGSFSVDYSFVFSNVDPDDERPLPDTISGTANSEYDLSGGSFISVRPDLTDPDYHNRKVLLTVSGVVPAGFPNPDSTTGYISSGFFFPVEQSTLELTRSYDFDNGGDPTTHGGTMSLQALYSIGSDGTLTLLEVPVGFLGHGIELPFVDED
jgi:hypothetical protein